MILVTVGTTKFPFNRLLKLVDKALLEIKGKKEKLIVQKGISEYQFQYKNKKVFNEVSYSKFIFYLKKARVVITHGGPGTIFLSLKHNKNKPLVLPRLRKFGEHTDDHQLFFARFLKRKNLVEIIFNKNQIITYLNNPQKNIYKKKLIPDNKLIKKLIEFTESL